jgi:adenylate cyclase
LELRLEHDTNPVVLWLIDGARSAPTADAIMTQLCDRLVACGLPLYRSSVFVRTLHPHTMGRRFTWQPDKPVEVTAAPYSVLESREYLESPVVHVYDTAVSLRRRLADPDCPLDFTVLPDFKSEGVTDYFATPLHFTNGEIHVATWTTRAPGGFSERQIAGLEAVAAPLARVAEIMSLRRIGITLLDTYVGHQAGERILSGKIRRGDTEAINAAIWLSDMRGFTALADRLAPQLLIDLLNRYFDAQVPAIVEAGGEVLKFMGDGLLAIFPVAPGDRDARAACAAAFTAAHDARARIAKLRNDETASGVRFGLALHLGEVLYGNIGGESRLDFTCIGPAVNLAARLEKLAGELGRAILASSDFAQRCPGLVPVGEFSLRGFEAAQSVYGLADEQAA